MSWRGRAVVGRTGRRHPHVHGRGKGVRGGGGASGRRRHKVCGMVELYHSHQCMSFCAVARSHRRFVFVCVLCFVFIERPVGFV